MEKTVFRSANTRKQPTPIATVKISVRFGMDGICSARTVRSGSASVMITPKENGHGVLVTGGAKRLGKAIACAFAEAGWRVAVHCYLSRKEADAVVRNLPGKGHCVVQGDFCSEQDCERLIPELVAAKFPLRC